MKPTIEQLYKLAADRSLKTNEIHSGNDFYGHATILKKYANIPKNYQIKAAIEHGAFIEDEGWKADFDAPLPALFTFSSFRNYFLKQQTNKKLFSIGPMLGYAHSYLSVDELNCEKRRLGKNLLVFPPHSTHWIDTEYDLNIYSKILKKIGEEFDSIRICLYWKDILRGIAEKYMEHGFECVTAGHIYDPLFLPRLKSLIDTASVTTSCQIGTHIGYCIIMNKPHYLYEIDVNMTSDSKEMLSEHEDYRNSVPANLLRKNFNKLQNHITTEQKKLINTYWGTEKLKTKEEIKTILRFTENLYTKRKFFYYPTEVTKESEFLIEGSLFEILKALENKLEKYPRRKAGKLKINNRALAFVDLHSFYHQAKQIFESNLYGFSSEVENPVILDCGAHIGLASIYFAQNYPKAQVYAFEADPAIAELLDQNIKSMGLKNVYTLSKAIWINDNQVFFNSSYDDSGYLKTSNDQKGIKISAFRLKNFLKENLIDLLKMDIEGSEYEVIEDCDGVLSNAKKIIVEVHKLQNECGSLGNILNILEKNNFEYILNDLHSADWVMGSRQPPFSAVKSDKYIVTIFAWQRLEKLQTYHKKLNQTVDNQSEIVEQCIKYLNKNDNKNAFKFINYAIEENKDIVARYYGKALVLSRMGQKQEAIEALTKLLENKPDHKNAQILFEALKIEENRLRDNDIVIASYPRSGNTWLRLLLSDSILQIHGFETDTNLPIHEDYVIPNIHDQNLHKIDPRLHLPFRLIKTHEQFSEIPKKTIFLFRHPADALCSYYYFHLQYENLKSHVREGIDKFCFKKIDDWCEHITTYISAKNKFPDKIFFISYELLHYQAEKALMDILELLQFKISIKIIHKAIENHTFQKQYQQEKLSGDIGSKYGEHFFRKGSIGTHKEELKQETIAHINTRAVLLYKQALDFQNRLDSHHKKHVRFARE